MSAVPVTLPAGESQAEHRRHVVTALVVDRPGTLNRVSGLLRARSTGQGCDVETCLYDVAMHQLTYPGLWYLNEGDVSARAPRSAHLSLAPVQTFPTRDGWIFVMCMTQKFWESLCEATGRRDLPLCSGGS